MAGEASRKNGKKGGRKPGTKSAKTLEREAVLRAARERVMNLTDKLLDGQLVLAFGQYFLFRIDKFFDSKGNLKAKKPKRVTDMEEIRKFIENDLSGGVQLNKPESPYYFFTTKEPSSHALTSLREFVFGKAVQGIALTDPQGDSIVDPFAKEKSDLAINVYLGKAKTKEN